MNNGKSLIRFAVWGLPLKDYLETTLVPKFPRSPTVTEHVWYLDLEEYLLQFTYDRIRWKSEQPIPNFVDRNGSLNDLWVTHSFEGEKHILFFQSIANRNNTYEISSILSTILEDHDNTAGQEFFYYLDQPYFYDRQYMDHNGVSITGIANPIGLAPGVPPLLRWWLTAHHVLSLKGIARIRPVVGRLYR